MHGRLGLNTSRCLSTYEVLVVQLYFTLFCWLLSIWWAFPMVLASLIPHRVTGNVQLVTWWPPANKELLFSSLLILSNERAALISNSLYKLLGFVLFSNDYLDFPVPILSCHFHSGGGARDIAKESQKYCLWSLIKPNWSHFP